MASPLREKRGIGGPGLVPTTEGVARITRPSRDFLLSCYNFAVFCKILMVGIALAPTCVCKAQGPSSGKQPQVKVNVLNVCTPSADEQKEIASALAGIPRTPALSADFEVDRGRSVLDPRANPLAMAGSGAIPTDTTAAADFVRIRHDLAGTTYL